MTDETAQLIQDRKTREEIKTFLVADETLDGVFDVYAVDRDRRRQRFEEKEAEKAHKDIRYRMAPYPRDDRFMLLGVTAYRLIIYSTDGVLSTFLRWVLSTRLNKTIVEVETIQGKVLSWEFQENAAAREVNNLILRLITP